MIMTVILFVLLFLVQTVILARSFGKHLSRRLEAMNEMTQKIQRRDLEFDEEHSDIKEIDQVMDSLYKMKCALKESLEEQWNQEKEKQEQIAALAHDIKTPLTIIKGNAQLLEEGSLAEEEQEYNQYILRNVAEIEHYLVMLQEMLMSAKETEEIETISCQELGGMAGRAGQTSGSCIQTEYYLHKRRIDRKGPVRPQPDRTGMEQYNQQCPGI